MTCHAEANAPHPFMSPKDCKNHLHRTMMNGVCHTKSSARYTSKMMHFQGALCDKVMTRKLMRRVHRFHHTQTYYTFGFSYTQF